MFTYCLGFISRSGPIEKINPEKLYIPNPFSQYNVGFNNPIVSQIRKANTVPLHPNSSCNFPENLGNELELESLFYFQGNDIASANSSWMVNFYVFFHFKITQCTHNFAMNSLF